MKLYGFLLIFLVLICLSFSVSGEDISLKELRYEIINGSDFNVTTLDTRTNMYRYAENFTENQYGYYNLSKTDSKDNFLLADTTYFNFSAYDEIWIDYYIPGEENITIEFLYSFVYGNETNPDDMKRYPSLYKEHYLVNNYYDYPLYSNWSMTHLNMYYSTDNYILIDTDMVRNIPYDYDDFVANDPKGTFRYAHHVYNNVSLPENSDLRFETFRYDIRNNFDSYYPELRLFTEIWLRNVTEIYIRDWGFNKVETPKEIEQWTTDNLTFFMTYGLENLLIESNQSDYSFPEYPSGNISSVMGFSPYSDDIQHFLKFDISEETSSTTYDYLFYKFHNYVEALPIFDIDVTDPSISFQTYVYMVILQTHEFNNVQYTEYYAKTGFHLYLNREFLGIHYKSYFNVRVSDNEYLDGTGETALWYGSPKQYYGFFYNNTIGNLSMIESRGDIYHLDSEFHTDDAVKIGEKSEGEEHEFYKIKGDWSAFDSIRKGLNKILEVMQIILYGILAFFQPLFDVLSSLKSAFEAIANQIYTLLEPLFTAIETAINTVKGVLDNIYSVLSAIAIQISGIVSQMAQVIADLASIIGLLTLAGWVQSIINVVITIAADLLTITVDLVNYIVAWFTIILTLIGYFFTILEQMVFIYLMVITGFMLIGMITNHNAEGYDRTGTIIHDWVYLMALPLIVLVNIIIGFSRIVISMIPGI